MKELKKVLAFYGKTVEDVKAIPVGKGFYYSTLSEPGEETSGLWVLDGEKISKDTISVREGYAEFRYSEPSFGVIKTYKI